MAEIVRTPPSCRWSAGGWRWPADSPRAAGEERKAPPLLSPGLGGAPTAAAGSGNAQLPLPGNGEMDRRGGVRPSGNDEGGAGLKEEEKKSLWRANN